MSAAPWTSADGRVSLFVGDSREVLRDIADASVDAVVCDPPYELGFMGRKWDASGIAYDVDLWREVLRVMKPGAHLLAFGGTRTYHRMTCAIEDAGLEIRDCIAWIYGSGFPKSLDVSKAIDKQRHSRADVYRVTAWVRQARDVAGITNRDIDAAFGFVGMAGHWTSTASQPAVPTLEQVPTLLEVLKVDEVPEEIRRLLFELNGRRGQPGKNWFARVVTGTFKSSLGGTVAAGDRNADFIGKHAAKVVERTLPATDDARRWAGWGTALKPAHEPIVVARKPLAGTVARNVLAHGTGAINVDGCRVGTTKRAPGSPKRVDASKHTVSLPGYGGGTGHDKNIGRWPANVALDEDAAQGMGEPSRYFYTAKASTFEREQGLAHRAKRKVNDGREATADNPRLRGESMRGNTHPTVKPIDLMRWLCRLVTPPNGLILDPFAGSGSTLIAAHAEGFRAVGIELDEEHASIARDRLGGHASLFVGLR